MEQAQYFDQLSEYEHSIALRDAVNNLMLNPDFKLVFAEYTEKLPISLTKLLGTLEKNEDNKDNLTRRLEAVGLFQTFLDGLVENGELAITDKLQLESDQDNHS